MDIFALKEYIFFVILFLSKIYILLNIIKEGTRTHTAKSFTS